jgi:signal transduction histidine kinase
MRFVVTPMTKDVAPLGAFVDYLHAVREEERVALARKIHDELGGLLVSAAMDLGWAESHSSGADVRMHLRRLGVNLASAIDMKRNMIEQLRPTLLDNFGLFEALRWYFKHACHHIEATCNEAYPPDEVALTPLALSNIFRATQTLLDCTFIEQGLKSVDFKASVQDEQLSIRIGHEHFRNETVDVLAQFPHELESAAHRMAAFEGELSFEGHEKGLVFYLNVPLRGAICAGSISPGRSQRTKEPTSTSPGG